MLNASFRCNANESENAIRAASGGRLRKNSVTGGSKKAQVLVLAEAGCALNLLFESGFLHPYGSWCGIEDLGQCDAVETGEDTTDEFVVLEVHHREVLAEMRHHITHF